MNKFILTIFFSLLGIAISNAQLNSQEVQTLINERDDKQNHLDALNSQMTYLQAEINKDTNEIQDLNNIIQTDQQIASNSKCLSSPSPCNSGIDCCSGSCYVKDEKTNGICK